MQVFRRIKKILINKKSSSHSAICNLHHGKKKAYRNQKNWFLSIYLYAEAKGNVVFVFWFLYGFFLL